MDFRMRAKAPQRGSFMMKPSPDSITQTVEFIAEELRRHIVFENDPHAFTISLWITGTYLMDNWGLYPKLYINSPERECGKTSLLCMIEAFAFNARMAASITPSAFYRIIQSEGPTELLLKFYQNQRLTVSGNLSKCHCGRHRFSQE